MRFDTDLISKHRYNIEQEGKIMRYLLLLCLPLLLISSDIKLQILGSGGPELDERASASYLIWVDGKARLLVDFGGGAFLRLGQSKAKISDIDTILLTHFHIDHVVDFAALVKASYFVPNGKVIKVFGPDGNRYFPNTKEFLKGMFDNKNVYGYMSDSLDTSGDCVSFQPYIFSYDTDKKLVNINDNDIDIKLIAVNHGNVPSLAYRVTINDMSIVFSGDTSAKTDNLIALAKNADILVAHHAIPEHAQGAAKNLHMIPSRIGEIAFKSGVKRVVLSHRMKRTIGQEKRSSSLIRKNFKGEVIWAEDLLMIPLSK